MLFFFLRSYHDFSAGTGVGFVFGLACGSLVATWLVIVQAIVLVRSEQGARRRGEPSVLGPR